VCVGNAKREWVPEKSQRRQLKKEHDHEDGGPPRRGVPRVEVVSARRVGGDAPNDRREAGGHQREEDEWNHQCRDQDDPVGQRDPEQLTAHQRVRHHSLDPGLRDRAFQRRNLRQRLRRDEPDALAVRLGHAHEHDVGFRLADGEGTHAFAIDREAVIHGAVRRVADARDGLAEEAIHQGLQVTGQRRDASTLALVDLQVPRGQHVIVALNRPDERGDRAPWRAAPQWIDRLGWWRHG
jgi:hypothetical protein